MPISDGYEACSNILSLFSDKKIFLQRNSCVDMINIAESSKSSISNYYLKPVVVANSSFVDQQIVNKTKLVGFDEVFETPMSSNSIVAGIMPLIKQR